MMKDPKIYQLWRHNIPGLNTETVTLRTLPLARFKAELDFITIKDTQNEQTLSPESRIMSIDFDDYYYFTDHGNVRFIFRLTVLGVYVRIINLRENECYIRIRKDRISFTVGSEKPNYTLGKDVLESMRDNKRYIPSQEHNKIIPISPMCFEDEIVIPFDLVKLYLQGDWRKLFTPCHINLRFGDYYFVREFLIKPLSSRPEQDEENVFAYADEFRICFEEVEFHGLCESEKKKYEFVFKVF